MDNDQQNMGGQMPADNAASMPAENASSEAAGTKPEEKKEGMEGQGESTQPQA